MSEKPYTPREGSIAHRLYQHLKQHGGSVTRKAAAELLSTPRNNLAANMKAAVEHGLVMLDDDGYRLPLGISTEPVADLHKVRGVGPRPPFPDAPPRAGDAVKDQGNEPPKKQTRKEMLHKLARDQNALISARTAVVAIEPPPAPTTALATASMEPASLRQIGGTHYKQMAVQPWDVVDDWPLEQRIGYYRGNALKYLMRMGSKDQDAQEIGKGRHYIEKLLEVLQEQNVQVAST
jgi:hypothetical protein